MLDIVFVVRVCAIHLIPTPSPRRRSGAIAPQGPYYLHHNLDSGVKPRNDTYKNVRNQYTNNIHKIKTRNNVRKNKINIQPVVIPAQAGIGSMKLPTHTVAQYT